MSKLCPSCQTPNDSSAKFCSQCGTPLPEVVPAPEEKVTPEINPEPVATTETVSFGTTVGNTTPKKKKSTFSIIRSSCVLFFSLLVLLFSFLPVVSAKVEDDEFGYYGYDIKFGFVDFCKFYVDTFYENYDYEDLEDSRFGERMLELADDIEERLDEKDEDETLSFKERSLLSSLLKMMIQAELRTKGETGFGSKQMPILVSVICAFCQIIISFALVLCAAKDLFHVLSGQAGESRSLLKCLAYLVPVSILNTFFAKKCISILLSLLENSYGEFDNVISPAIVKWTVAFCAVSLLLYALPNILSSIKTSVGTWLSRFAAVFFSVLLLASLPFSVINANVTGYFGSSSREKTVAAPLGIEYFATLDLTEDELEELTYNGARISGSTSFRYISKSQVAKGKINSAITQTGICYLTDGGENYFLLYFKYAYFLFFILGLFICELVAESLVQFASGKTSKSLMTWNTVCMVFSVLALIIAISLILLTNINSSKVLSFAIGNGPIFAIVFSIIIYLTSLFRGLDKMKKKQ